MKHRFWWRSIALVVSLTLVACGGENSTNTSGAGSTDDSGDTVVTEKYSDYLKDGIFETRDNEIIQLSGNTGADTNNWTLAQHSRFLDLDSGQLGDPWPTTTNTLSIFDPTRQEWVEEGFANNATENADGTLTQGAFKLALSSIDVSGKPVAEYVPFTSYVRSGVSITDGTKFSNGAKQLQIKKTLLADRYELNNNGYTSTYTVTRTIDDLIENTIYIKLGGYFDEVAFIVRINQVNPEKTSGTLTITKAVNYTDNTSTNTRIDGSWNKVQLSPSVAILELTGLPLEATGPQRSVFLTVNQNQTLTGFHFRPQTFTGNADHTTAYFNKVAIEDIKANLHWASEIGGLAGYGKTLEAKTALENGINSFTSDSYGGGWPAYYTRLTLQTNADGSLEQANGDGLIYQLNGKQFTPTNDATTRSGIYLDGQQKNWAQLSGNNQLIMQADGSALLQNTWNGENINVTFTAVDLKDKFLAEFDPTGILKRHFKPYAKFSAGAQWLTLRQAQQTSGYVLWGVGNYPWGYGQSATVLDNISLQTCSTLDELVNGADIDAWIGQLVRMKFVPGTAGATTGTLQVHNMSGQALGNGTWERKTVHGVEMIEIISLPAGVAKGYFANNIHRIYSVYNGKVNQGMAILPGKIHLNDMAYKPYRYNSISNFSDHSMLFNDQAIKDIEAAVW